MRKARLLITKHCERRCGGCCNNYSRIMAQMETISSLERFEGYDVVCITGGEPMLFPVSVINCAEKLKDLGVKKVYLYTALWTVHFRDVVTVTDGVHFTIHYPCLGSEIGALMCVQKDLARLGWTVYSNRLYVDNRINEDIPIVPAVWARVDMSPWLTEDEVFEHNGPSGLPQDEELFFFERG